MRRSGPDTNPLSSSRRFPTCPVIRGFLTMFDRLWPISSQADIEPSKDRDLLCYPCRVTLRTGPTLDTVYIEPELPYLRAWGIHPEDDRAKQSIRIENVMKVEDSPTRLPARFANEIYRHRESGMGYTVFAVIFADGSRPACITGNAVDFIR